MPHFRLETNLPKEKIPQNFARELNKIISQALGEGKPEEICATTIVPDQIMVHGTKEGPCGQATFICIGKFGVKENIRYSKVISDKIAELGIPADRCYIIFNDIKSHEVGVSGTTYKELLGE